MKLSQCHTLKELQGFLSKPLFYVSDKRKVKKFKGLPRFVIGLSKAKPNDVFPGLDIYDNEEEARSLVPPKPPKPREKTLTPLEKRIYDFLGTHGDGYGEDKWMEMSLGRGMILKISDRWFDITNIDVSYKTVGVGWDQSEILFQPKDRNWNLTEEEKVSRKIQIVDRVVGLYNYSKALVKALRGMGFGKIITLDKDDPENMFRSHRPVLCCRLFKKWELFASSNFVGICKEGKIFELARSDEIIQGFRKLVAKATEEGLCLDGRPFLDVLPRGLMKLLGDKQNID